MALGFIVGFFFCLATASTVVGRAHWIRPPKPVDQLSLEQKQKWLHRSWAHYAFVATHGHGRVPPVKRPGCEVGRPRARPCRRADARPVAVRAAGIRNAFLCIHHGEGSWTDPATPPTTAACRWTSSFSRRTAPRCCGEGHGGSLDAGRADPRRVRGVPAHELRGFYPWPNTAVARRTRKSVRAIYICMAGAWSGTRWRSQQPLRIQALSR
jgi:hypothetical protein